LKISRGFMVAFMKRANSWTFLAPFVLAKAKGRVGNRFSERDRENERAQARALSGWARFQVWRLSTFGG
jgi:hypothetical protein